MLKTDTHRELTIMQHGTELFSLFQLVVLVLRHVYYPVWSCCSGQPKQFQQMADRQKTKTQTLNSYKSSLIYGGDSTRAKRKVNNGVKKYNSSLHALDV